MNKVFFIFALVVFTFTSCEENEPEIQDDAQNWVEIRNNDQLLTLLNQLDAGKDLTELLPNVKFISMWDIFQEILKADENNQKELIEQFPNIVKISTNENGAEIKLNLNDQTLAKLLSVDGYIKVGEKIIKAEGDVFKVITNGDKTLISKLKQLNEFDKVPNILVEKIVSYKSNSSNLKDVKKATSAWAYWEGYEYYNSETRCNWDKWIDYNPVFDYTDVGAEVTNQRKSWLGWANWFSSSSYMYLHLRSEYLYCPDFSYDRWSELMGHTPRLDLTVSGNTTNVRVNKRFSGTRTPSSGHVEIDFIYRGTTYYH